MKTNFETANAVAKILHQYFGQLTDPSQAATVWATREMVLKTLDSADDFRKLVELERASESATERR